MFTGFDKTVNDRQLAKVTTAASGQAGRKARWTASTDGPLGLPAVSTPFATDLPTTNTAYFSPGVPWSGRFEKYFLDQGDRSYVSTLASGARSYRAGALYQRRLNAAVLGPAFPDLGRSMPFAGRRGDVLVADLPPLSDQDGNAGAAWAGVGHSRLYRDGRLVSMSKYPGHIGTDGLDARRGDFTLETSVDRRSVSTYSTQVRGTWRFRSAHVAGKTFRPLPLWAVRFAPNVDAYNTAKRQPLAWLPMSARRRQMPRSARCARCGCRSPTTVPPGSGQRCG